MLLHLQVFLVRHAQENAHACISNLLEERLKRKVKALIPLLLRDEVLKVNQEPSAFFDALNLSFDTSRDLLECSSLFLGLCIGFFL